MSQPLQANDVTVRVDSTPSQNDTGTMRYLEKIQVTYHSLKPFVFKTDLEQGKLAPEIIFSKVFSQDQIVLAGRSSLGGGQYSVQVFLLAAKGEYLELQDHLVANYPRKSRSLLVHENGSSIEFALLHPRPDDYMGDDVFLKSEDLEIRYDQLEAAPFRQCLKLRGFVPVIPNREAPLDTKSKALFLSLRKGHFAYSGEE